MTRHLQLVPRDVGPTDPAAFLVGLAQHKRDLPAFLRVVAEEACRRKERTVRFSPGFVRLLADHLDFGER